MRAARYMVIDMHNGQIDYVHDPEVADHVSMYPDDYVLWRRVTIRSVGTVTYTGLDRVDWDL